MRALTLHQPWAALVASGVKLIENRPMRPPANLIGERFAIHAGQGFVDLNILDRIREIAPDVAIPPRLHLGSILATARLVTYVTLASQITEYTSPDQERWFFGPVGYVLADVRELATPIACRGMQGFWPVPEDVANEIAGMEWRAP